MALYNIGSSGSEVSNLQQLLQNAGFSPGAIDGIYGNNTASAVKAFQQAAGITVDGIYGPQTMNALSNYKPTPAPQPAAPPAAPSPIQALPTSTPVQSQPVTQSYQSPYEQQIADALAKIQSRPAFAFDPESDPGFQEASKQIQSKIMLDFAKRNMLYSPATGQAVSEGVASAMPQYEQAAYQRYMAEGENMYNTLNVLLSLDTRSFNMYQSAVENDYREWEKSRTERLDKLDEQYKRIDYAYKKLDEMEVADNEIASILGIPVGTKSQAAKQRAEEFKNQLEIMRREEEAQARQQARSFANEKALIDYRNQIDQKNQEQAQGTPEQQHFYNELLKLYTTDPYWKDDPYKALQASIMMQSQQVGLLGQALYDKLQNTLQAYASVSGKMNSSQPTSKNLSMTEIDNTIASMTDAAPEDIGGFIITEMLNSGYPDTAIVAKLQENGLGYNQESGTVYELK